MLVSDLAEVNWLVIVIDQIYGCSKFCNKFCLLALLANFAKIWPRTINNK